MKCLTIIGAVTASLAFVAPAMAANGWEYHAHAAYHGPAVYDHLRAQDYDHFDYGVERPTFHSGWGGPYGDGDYPGTIDQNMGPPYWAY